MFRFLIFLVIFLLFFGMMISGHELVHQMIYEKFCDVAETSIHMASLKEIVTEQLFAYTEIEIAKGCSDDLELANLINDIVGYVFIIPLSLIGGMAAANLYS